MKMLHQLQFAHAHYMGTVSYKSGRGVQLQPQSK